MIDYQELTQMWQTMSGLAPELMMPIVNDETLSQATQALRALDREMSASPLRPHPLADLADAAMHRIMNYEAEHYPVPDADGSEMLAFILEQRGLSQRGLAEATGIPQSTISNLIKRKRAFTADHVRTFAQHFGVNAGVFL